MKYREHLYGVNKHDEGSGEFTTLLDYPPLPFDFHSCLALATMAARVRYTDCSGRQT